MEGDKNGKVSKKITITDCGEIERKVDDHARHDHHWSNSNLTDVHQLNIINLSSMPFF